MNSDFTAGSSLTFSIKNSTDIHEVLQLIKAEARKENCLESEVTLISTAVSEVCRKFMEYAKYLELTLTILNQSADIELQGKALVKTVPEDVNINVVMRNLNTYFGDTIIQETDTPPSLSYSFHKKIPKADTSQGE